MTSTRGNAAKRTNTPRVQKEPSPPAVVGPIPPTDDDPESGSDNVCFICAETVKFYSLSECNHRTCHVCALRLRALYKKRECTFCKHPQDTMLFTTSPDKLFQNYNINEMQSSDEKLSVVFETREMMEESLVLLRFNCPDPDCDYVANGWPDLKWHVRDRHGKVMCDLCIRSKKIFSHEHTLYLPHQLPSHLPSLARRNVQSKEKEKEKEVDSHPMCDFCKDCFYGDDELYAHLRERHEECFVCKKQGVTQQYFLNYEKLALHFRTDHFLCPHRSCLEQKFVVFPTQLDLQAHTVDVHSDEMTNRDKRGARRIEVPFEHAQRVGGIGRGRGGGSGQPEPPPPPSRSPSAAVLSGAPVRVLAGGSRRAAFGGQLTGSGLVENPPVREQAEEKVEERKQEEEVTATGSTTADPLVLEQHAAFMTHVQSLTGSPKSLVAIRSSIKSYRSNESTVYDMLDTIFSVVDRNLDKLGSMINRLADLFDNEEKRDELLEAWGGMRVEHQKDLPTLTPLSSANSSNYAGITSGRVINIKRATPKQSASNRSTRGIWDRVEQAATSSTASASQTKSKAKSGLISNGRVVPGATAPLTADFPSLSIAGNPSPGGSRSNTPNPSHRSATNQHTTPWTQSSSSAPAPIQPYSVNVPQAQTKVKGKQPAPPPITSSAQFPQLPASNSKNDLGYKKFVGGNQSLRSIVGEPIAPPTNPWGSGSGGVDETNESDIGGLVLNENTGKRKKKKGKETLFTLGTL